MGKGWHCKTRKETVLSILTVSDHRAEAGVKEKETLRLFRLSFSTPQ